MKPPAGPPIPAQHQAIFRRVLDLMLAAQQQALTKQTSEKPLEEHPVALDTGSTATDPSLL